jgi:hypothetical protein
VRRQPKPPRIRRVEIRWSEAEYVQIESEADKCCLTLSEFVRRRAMGKRVVSRFDDRVLIELSRLGGNVRRLGAMQKRLAMSAPPNESAIMETNTALLLLADEIRDALGQLY